MAILQEAGLPILRSLKILENQSKPGALKNSLIDVCEEIEGGSTLSEAMAKSPKAFNRLYVNMIKAGEAGGALEIILKRLAEFQERAQSLKRKVRGRHGLPDLRRALRRRHPGLHHVEDRAPVREDLQRLQHQAARITEHADRRLPLGGQLVVPPARLPHRLLALYQAHAEVQPGRMGWDFFKIKVPIFGQLIEKDIVARTMRTLGTLVASGVPILEALHITRETSGNAAFEKMFGRVYDSIREGESIAKPMKENSFVLKGPGAMPALGFMALMLFPIGLMSSARSSPCSSISASSGHAEWFLGRA